MCLIATATASWDGDDVSFGDGDEMCVSGAEATGGSSSLPGSSLLLPPDTPWLALTGTSRAGLAQPIHERARARKPNPAPHFLVARTSHSTSASEHQLLLLLLLLL